MNTTCPGHTASLIFRGNTAITKELAKRVSEIHATAVTQRIKSLNCPTTQKLELLDTVIETVKERSKEQS